MEHLDAPEIELTSADEPRVRNDLSKTGFELFLPGNTFAFFPAFDGPLLFNAATFAIFLGVLLWRPQGLFGRA